MNINMTYLIKHVAYIYRSAIRSCRPGGVIVYSTCTLTPGQNDYVIEAAVTQLRQLHPDIEIMVQDTSCIRDRLNHVFKFWPGSRYVCSNNNQKEWGGNFNAMNIKMFFTFAVSTYIHHQRHDLLHFTMHVGSVAPLCNSQQEAVNFNV